MKIPLYFNEKIIIFVLFLAGVVGWLEELTYSKIQKEYLQNISIHDWILRIRHFDIAI